MLSYFSFALIALNYEPRHWRIMLDCTSVIIGGHKFVVSILVILEIEFMYVVQ